MKVSQLIMKLLKVDADLDVCLQANKPESDGAEGVIEPVEVVEVISIKTPDGGWKKVQVTLRADDKEDE